MSIGRVQTTEVGEFFGLRTDTPASKCPSNYSPDCADMVFTVGGMATRNPFSAVVTMPAEMVYRKEFICKNGSTQVLAVDVNGVLYTVAANGTYTQIDTVAPGSSVSSVTAYGREYMAFFNARGGCDAPRQWDGKNLYRVSQGGPGAPPVFAASEISTDSYPIASISQAMAQTRGSSYFLQSNGTGLQGAGTTVTVYYSDSTVVGPDNALVAAFNTGNPVYLYFSFTGGPAEQGPVTVLVTSVGEASPPGQPRSFYYFTYETTTTSYIYYLGANNPGYTANYQQTLATITTTEQVPGVYVGDNIVISGTSKSNYNSTWPVTQTPSSAAFAVTQTQLTAGVATYSYILSSGVAPVAGQQVEVAGTLNADGALNVGDPTDARQNVTIATASGGATDTFTIAGFESTTDYPASQESGSGVTAGTTFIFDPGATTLGTSTSPIYGGSAGGYLIFAGTAAVVASGTRQGVVLFLTDTDAITAPSTPVKFTIPANTNAIAFSQLPIGPANIQGRILAFTGANGSNYFYLLTAPQVNGIVTGTSTVINDNTTTSGTVYFTDDALLAGNAIDIPGNNTFEQVALNLPRGVDWYQNRLFWMGEANTVNNLENMGMDGGTLEGSPAPLGWTQIGSGAIQQVGIMPAYIVTGPNTGELTQTAYQTTNGTQIIQPLLNYSLRFWMLGTGSKVGQLIATLSSASTAFTSTATYNLAGLEQSGYSAINFSATMPASIPSDMTLSVQFAGLPAGSVATIRDLQMIYADNPNRNPISRTSYVQNPEAYDAETGNCGPSDDATELRSIFVLQESLYFITQRGLYSVQSIGNSEPSSWDVTQISDKCGSFNANAVTTGKGWATWGGPDGAFWYSGGLPDKVSAIIAPTWRDVASVASVYDDPDYERVYFAVLDDTGTQSLLTYDYHEMGTGGPGKWCPWNRAASWVGYSASGTTFIFGSGFYQLETEVGITDENLGSIGGYYTFAPFGLSMFRKDYSYMGLRVAGMGVLTPFLYTSTLGAVTQTLRGQELSTVIDTVAEWDQNVRGRLMFMKVGQAGVQYALEDATILYQADPNAPITGVR